MKLLIDIPDDVYTRLFDNGIQDNEIAVDDVCEMARALRKGIPYEERPQDEWFNCVSNGLLKARHGDYVVYKVDYLLDHLAREVFNMEGARRMKPVKEADK